MYKNKLDISADGRYISDGLDSSLGGCKYYFTVGKKEVAIKSNQTPNLNKVYYCNMDEDIGIDIRVRGDMALNPYSIAEYNYTQQDRAYSSLHPEQNIPKLRVHSEGIVNGLFKEKYGTKGYHKIRNMPICSIPLTWSDGPMGTKTYAVTLIDNEAIDIYGFPWIHWLVADIPAQITSLQENISRHHDGYLTEGLTSFADDYLIKLSELGHFKVPSKYAIGYGGFTSFDKPHTYIIKVYALNSKLNLKPGFTYNELLRSMEGRVLAQGIYSAKYDE